MAPPPGQQMLVMGIRGALSIGLPGPLLANIIGFVSLVPQVFGGELPWFALSVARRPLLWGREVLALILGVVLRHLLRKRAALKPARFDANRAVG